MADGVLYLMRTHHSDFSSFLNLLKKINPWSFEFHFNTSWGSQADDYRRNVRLDLAQRYLFKIDVTNTAELPQPVKGSLSITHTGPLGAFIYCADRSVGLDLEEQHRVTPAIAHRVSTKNEAEIALSPSLFWVAKEAGFKAARPLAPAVLSSIELLAASEIKEGVFRFKAQVKNSVGLLDGIAQENISINAGPPIAIAVSWLKGLNQ